MRPRFGRTTLPDPPPPPDCLKFRSFSFARHHFVMFLFQCVSSRGFFSVCEDRDPQTFGLLGCRVKPRHPHRAAGARTRQPENSKRAYLSVPVFKNTTKIQREDPQRRKKRTNLLAGEGKKRAKFWAPHPSRPPFSTHKKNLNN